MNGTKSNAGREWQPKGRPERTDVHDFPDKDVPKAIPYGVLDVWANEGWMSVGDDHDTGAFAVNAIRRWWEEMGAERYPKARRLMVTADAGGSNGYRNRLWRRALATLAEETGLQITVCHYPPGTSKWNKVEHRLFSFITINWRGRPLTSYRGSSSSRPRRPPRRDFAFAPCGTRVPIRSVSKAGSARPCSESRAPRAGRSRSPAGSRSGW